MDPAHSSDAGTQGALKYEHETRTKTAARADDLAEDQWLFTAARTLLARGVAGIPLGGIMDGFSSGRLAVRNVARLEVWAIVRTRERFFELSAVSRESPAREQAE